MQHERLELEMVTKLETAVGHELQSVIVYGPAAHDDHYPGIATEHLLVVLADLGVATLRRLGDPVRWWLRKGQTWPRLFSSDGLRSSADVYPIELLEIAHHRRVVFGSDPMVDVEINDANLRTQCERELREKLMRLREGYVELHGRSTRKDLDDLLAVSYASFVRIFRACLYLVDAPIAARDREVVTALCRWLDRSPEPFLAVDHIARHDRRGDVEAIFAEYYRELTAIEVLVDRMIIHPERTRP